MLTRAQALMIVVGDALLLQEDPNWRKLLTIWKNAGVCIGDPFDLFKKNRLRIVHHNYPSKETIQLLPSISYSDALKTNSNVDVQCTLNV